MKSILVSVIMSVYNAELYLEDAIKSILSQSYENFEFIIINDGSNDKSLDIIRKYKNIDNRINLINNSENKGLIYSLNKGLEIAKGKYIARMDADDIALKDRFLKQVKYMENNKDIALLGTNIYMFRNSNKFLKKKWHIINNIEEIRVKMFFGNFIAHPTVMIRKSILDKYGLKYNINHRGMEDYGLWIEILKNDSISNLDQALLKYRFLSTSITSKENKNIEERFGPFKNIHEQQLVELGVDTKYIREFFEIQLFQYVKEKKTTLEKKEEFLKVLVEKNEEKNIYNKNLFNKECANKFLNVCTEEGSYYIYNNSILSNFNKHSKTKFIVLCYKNKFKKFIKCILR